MSFSKPISRPWSWTLVQAEGFPINYYHLHCSPEGELLMIPELVGKPFNILKEHAVYARSPEPSPQYLAMARRLAPVQIDLHRYTAASLIPNGMPQVPPEKAHKDHAVQKPDGLWCFLDKTSTTVPEYWESRRLAAPKNQSHQSPPALTPTDKPKEPVLVENTTQPTIPNEPVPSPAQAPVPRVPTQNDQLKESEEPKTEKQSNQTTSSTANHGNGARTEVSRSRDPKNSQITQLPTYQILNDLETLISNYLVCSAAQRTVLALWILHTYAYDATTLTPYLNIYSPMEESGKSTCMTILRGLCAHPWWAAGSSPAFFKRKLISEKTTVLLDNWHTLFRGSDKHPMSGFLLNGCDFVPDFCARAQRVQNHSVETCRFSPKAFAGMESLPPALARRSIPIVLQRRKPGERVKSAPFLMFPPYTEKLIAAMKAWAKDHTDTISQYHASYQTQAIPGLAPHQQESVKVLLALARAIGGDWLLKAYEALREVFDNYNQSQTSPTQLLSDIRDAFAQRGYQERIFTAELLEDLHDLDHRTYHEWSKKGDPMTAHALSAMLRKHFGIYSRSQRRGQQKLRGYQLSDFIEVWERYLPPPNEDLPAPATKDKPTASSESTSSTKSTTSIKSTSGAQASSQKLEASGFAPAKSRPVSMSHSKASSEKVRTKTTSRLRNFASKTLRIFTAIWS